MNNNGHMHVSAYARPLIVPFFLPQAGCNGRCVFCNQSLLTGKQLHCLPDQKEVAETLESYLNTSRSKNWKTIEAAFYGGSFNLLPQLEQERLLSLLRPYLIRKEIDGIRLSCRPEGLDAAVVDNYRQWGVTTIEIGAQSQHQDILAQCNRQYRPGQTLSAILRVKKAGIKAGAHIMVGLPGDTPYKSLTSLMEILMVKPSFLRIHPTLVLRGSLLEQWYEQQIYQPWSLGQTVNLLTAMTILAAQSQTPVVRWGLMPGELLENAVVAGPAHPALGEWVKRLLAYKYALALLEKSGYMGRMKSIGGLRKIWLVAPDKDISLLTGAKGWLLKNLEGSTGLILGSKAQLTESIAFNYLPFHGDWALQIEGEDRDHNGLFLSQMEFFSKIKNINHYI